MSKTLVAKPVVAHVAGCYFNLSENWIHTQVKHLHRWQPLVLTWQTKNLETCTPPLPPIYALLERSRAEHVANRIIRRLGLGYFPSFLWLLKKHKVRLLHAHFGPLATEMLPLARTAKIPLVTTFYGYDLSMLPKAQPEWKEKYARLFEQGTYFLVEGNHMRNQLMALGCPEEKIQVHHLGVDLSTLPFQGRRIPQGEPLRVLAAGRFTEKKGFVYAVQAFARFLADGGRGELTPIGDAGESDDAQQQIKRELLQTIRQAGIGDHIEFRGFQPHAELKKAYYEHHVLLAPSVQARNGDNEGGAPVTIIEAQATGLPVIATHHCDIPEAVLDERSGLLAPERDPLALANHLNTVARSNGRLQAMGEAGRTHVEEEYDACKQGQKLEAIYAQVCQER